MKTTVTESSPPLLKDHSDGKHISKVFHNNKILALGNKGRYERVNSIL